MTRLLPGLLGAGLVLITSAVIINQPVDQPSVEKPATVPISTPTSRPADPTATPTPGLPQELVLIEDVPFVVQAPLAQWQDKRYQNACEEAALLMAYYWTQGQAQISPQQATQEIAQLVAYEIKTWGQYVDHSTADTAKIMQDYFGYGQVQVFQDITPEQIIQQLQNNKLVIAAMDGQKLNNPYFTPPGPEQHMIVFLGYDPSTDEFITHDPGTRRGKNFRYARQTIAQALRDYPTGEHLPITQVRKNMFVVGKPDRS